MPYQDATLYVMSGTGNSFRVATWAAEDAAAAGAETRVVLLDAARPAEEVQAGPDHLVGLTFPTHGFTAPWAPTPWLCPPAPAATSAAGSPPGWRAPAATSSR
jgi:hypothetical protein